MGKTAGMALPQEGLLELPFDRYQRYTVLSQTARAIKARKGKTHLKVLDVGGYPQVACQFLPEEQTVAMDTEAAHGPGYVQANGLHLPFASGTFDLVACLDTLEHVPALQRGELVTELYRASDDFVVITTPVASEETQLAEEILAEFVFRALREIHPALRQHQEHGLPQLEDCRRWVTQEAPCSVDFPSGYLPHWLFMMVAKHYLEAVPDSERLRRMVDRFYNQHFSPDDHRGPAYRQVFVSSKGGDATTLEAIRQLFTAPPSERPQDWTRDLALFQLATALVEWRLPNRVDQELERLICEKDAHIANLQQIVREQEELLQAIARGRFMRLMSFLRTKVLGQR